MCLHGADGLQDGLKLGVRSPIFSFGVEVSIRPRRFYSINGSPIRGMKRLKLFSECDEFIVVFYSNKRTTFGH